MKKRYYALDALRGIFAVLIVLYHMYDYNVLVDNFFINKSLIFVDYFFVLSGFVIMHNYKSRINSFASLRQFVINRFWRLYPLHLFCLVLIFLLELFKYVLHSKGILAFPPFTSNTFERLIGQLFLVNSAGLIVGENFTGQWNYPSWSISGEYIAYITFALSILVFSKKLKQAGFVLILSILIYIYIDYQDFNIISTTSFGFLRAIYGFFIGVITYDIISKSKLSIGKLPATFLQIFITALIILMMYYWESTRPFSALFPILFGFGILGFIREDTYISKLLLSKTMQILGERSYSIYMIHVIILFTTQIITNRILRIDNSFISFLIPLSILLMVILLSGYTHKYIEIYFYKKFKK